MQTPQTTQTTTTTPNYRIATNLLNQVIACIWVCCQQRKCGATKAKGRVPQRERECCNKR